MPSSAEEAASALAGRRALVTGAAGFIGSHLVRRLLETGCDVTALVRPSTDRWRLAELGARPRLAHADLADLDIGRLAPTLADADVVFHLAAAGVDQSAQDASALLRTNVEGTHRLLQLAQRLGARRFVYCGSCFEYGAGVRLAEEAPLAPTSEYGAAKAAGGILAHAFGRRYGLPVVTLRPFTVYGPLEAPRRLVPSTIASALSGAALALTPGEQTRDFVYVDDAADAFLTAATAPNAVDGVFNVCTGAATSVRGLTATVIELTGSAVRPQFGALPYRPGEMMALSGDPRRAATVLGWTARTPLREGLARTIAWARERQAVHLSRGLAR